MSKIWKYLISCAIFAAVVVGIIACVISTHTVYRFPPDVCEWFFSQPVEEIAAGYNFKFYTYSGFDKNGSLVLLVNDVQEQNLLEFADTNDSFDAALENDHIYISPDFRQVTVTCYDEDTWENDVKCATDILFICLMKQLFNGQSPEKLGVYYDILDGLNGKTVFHTYWQGGNHSYELGKFSFMQ